MHQVHRDQIVLYAKNALHDGATPDCGNVRFQGRVGRVLGRWIGDYPSKNMGGYRY
jgi:hypothetical protein